MNDDDLLREFDTAAAAFQDAAKALNAVVFGQEDVVALSLATLAAGGHGLLVGPPGVAKTLLVSSLGAALGLRSKRIQFTPDLMPADVLGAEVLEDGDDGKRTFRFIPGPIFGQLLMADEINRASPRTQSALLQAMQEGYVTVAGARHDLPQPFHVLATQNPIEHEGTYPLPEAQLDRFLMQIDVAYPERDAEKRMLAATTGAQAQEIAAHLSPDDLMKAQSVVRAMPIGDALVDAILTLTRSARPEPVDALAGGAPNGAGNGAGEGPGEAKDLRALVNASVAWGPGPRASQALSLAARALALIDGRRAPSPDDLRRLAGPVLHHRLALTFSARADGMTPAALIAQLTEAALGSGA
ncbi:MAG: MoxR family ATPase [Pseudomonadota bacterium]